MSAIFSSTDKPTKINRVQINQSVSGYPLPVVMGKAKVQQSLLWIDGMSAKAVSQGGKGLGGGKGGSSYLYSADVIAALCAGPINGIGDVWAGQSWLSNNNAQESYTVTGGTPTYTPANAGTGFFVDNGVGITTAYSRTQTDLGASGGVTLSGSDLVAMQRVTFGSALSTGQYSVNPSTNAYSFSTADNGKTVQISYSFALDIIKQQETDLIPAGKTIQVGGTFVFQEDDGVIYPVTGVAFTKVSGTPTVTGTYSVSGSAPATYHFATGDIGAEVLITYKIQNSAAVPTGAPGTLAFSVFEGTKAQAVWSFLTTSFPQAALGYTSIAYVAYEPMSLGFAAEVQENVFEVMTPDAYGSGIVDCNPVQCVGQVLTNPVWGLGNGAVPFPASAIDNGAGGTWGGPFQATRVTSLGGSSLFKLFYGTATSVNGQRYITSCMIRNNSGVKTVRVSDNFGNGQNVLPGATAAVVVYGVGNGVSALQLEFSALSVGDTLDFTVWNMSITTGLGGANLILNQKPGSSGWGGGTGNTLAYTTDRPADSTAWSWFAANSFFISPVIDHQDSASALISKWLEAGLCSIFMSEGLLKMVPYGDTSTAGNGATWAAPATFAAALDDTCYVRKSKGQDPVKISSSPWQDAYNTVQVQWNNRTNQYAPEVTPESDQAAINRYGSRIEDPQNWDFITTLPAATFAASMRVKRNVYTRNTYEFTLPFSYAYLENMDVVSITTSSQWAAGLNNGNLAIVNLPVRIQKTVDNPDGSINFTAEDYPFGVHQPTIYNKGIGAGQIQPNLFADPGNSEIVMFEASNRLTQQQGNEIWIGATGVSDNWGACNVFVSQDGTTYKQIGTIDKVARMGVLHSSLATGSDPDTTHTMIVDMVENSGQLDAGTTTDADLDTTLCFVDGELISYSACAISGQGQYTMGTYMRRGRMGSIIGAHAAGALFLRLDDSVFQFKYDPTWQGKTLHFKFQSVNTFGNSAQDLSTLTAVSFTVPGLNKGTVDASSGLIINQQTNSTFLNPQGSIIPNQPINTPTFTSTTTSISFSWSSQSMQLSDGSTVTIPSGSKAYSGLSANTLYFFYPFIRTSDFTIQWANGTPPPTSASAAFALAANSDGCYGMTPIQARTPSSGTSGGGGGGTCPDSRELVEVQGKGQIAVSAVECGDLILGHSFKANADVYRRVTSVTSGVCGAWRVITGHKVSPCELVWNADGSSYMPAFKVPGATFDGSAGIKVMLHVDTDEFEECNYYLVQGTRLLIHNFLPGS